MGIFSSGAKKAAEARKQERAFRAGKMVKAKHAKAYRDTQVRKAQIRAGKRNQGRS